MKTRRMFVMLGAMVLGAAGAAASQSPAAQPPAVPPAGGTGGTSEQLVEQLAQRVAVLEANLDFVYRTLAYKQGDPIPSITSAQKNAQGLYSSGPGPTDAALAARVTAFRAAQEKALQGGTTP
jgi:hypothetical protein